MLRHIFRNAPCGNFRFNTLVQAPPSSLLPLIDLLRNASARGIHSTSLSCNLHSRSKSHSQKRKRNNQIRGKRKRDLSLDLVKEEKKSLKAVKGGERKNKSIPRSDYVPERTESAMRRIDNRWRPPAADRKKKEDAIGTNMLSLATAWTRSSTSVIEHPLVDAIWNRLTLATTAANGKHIDENGEDYDDGYSEDDEREGGSDSDDDSDSGFDLDPERRLDSDDDSDDDSDESGDENDAEDGEK
jgi:hypothetical protein